MASGSRGCRARSPARPEKDPQPGYYHITETDEGKCKLELPDMFQNNPRRKSEWEILSEARYKFFKNEENLAEIKQCRDLIDEYKRQALADLLTKPCTYISSQVNRQVLRAILKRKKKALSNAIDRLEYIQQHYVTVEYASDPLVEARLYRLMDFRESNAILQRENRDAEALLNYAKTVEALKGESLSFSKDEKDDFMRNEWRLDDLDRANNFLALCRKSGIDPDEPKSSYKKFDELMKREECLIKADVLLRVTTAVKNMQVALYRYISPVKRKNEEEILTKSLVNRVTSAEGKSRLQYVKKHIVDFDTDETFEKQIRYFVWRRNRLTHPYFVHYATLWSAFSALMRGHDERHYRSFGNYLKMLIRAYQKLALVEICYSGEHFSRVVHPCPMCKLPDNLARDDATLPLCKDIPYKCLNYGTFDDPEMIIRNPDDLIQWIERWREQLPDPVFTHLY